MNLNSTFIEQEMEQGGLVPWKGGPLSGDAYSLSTVMTSVRNVCRDTNLKEKCKNKNATKNKQDFMREHKPWNLLGMTGKK